MGEWTVTSQGQLRQSFGFATAGSAQGPGGSLTDSTFTYDGQSYTVVRLASLMIGASSDVIDFSVRPLSFPPLVDFTPLALYLGSLQLWMDDAGAQVGTYLRWSSNTINVNWSAGDQVIVRITDSTKVSEPGAPDVVASAGDGQATLAWTPAADEGGSPVTGYEYRYRRQTDAEYPESWTEVAGGADARSATVPRLYNGVPYDFQVRARNRLKAGHSAEASATLSGPGRFVSLSPDLLAVAEDAGAAVLTVSLDRPAASPLSVAWSTQDLDAEAPNDFTAREGPLTFAAGERRKDISIPIVDDAEREDPVNDVHETFFVVLYRGEGYSLSDDDAAIVEIVDNDGDAPPDETPPMLTRAAVNASTLVLTYDETLDGASVPAAGDFVVTAAENRINVQQVSVGGSAVTLTLASAVQANQTVTLDYTPGANPIQDMAGNDAAALSGQHVTNNTPGGGGGGGGGGRYWWPLGAGRACVPDGDCGRRRGGDRLERTRGRWRRTHHRLRVPLRGGRRGARGHAVAIRRAQPRVDGHRADQWPAVRLRGAGPEPRGRRRGSTRSPAHGGRCAGSHAVAIRRAQPRVDGHRTDQWPTVRLRGAGAEPCGRRRGAGRWRSSGVRPRTMAAHPSPATSTATRRETRCRKPRRGDPPSSASSGRSPD